MKTVSENLAEGKYTNNLPFGGDRKQPDWQEVRAAYNAENERVLALFRADLEAEYGTANYSKRDKLYALAWEYGHSSGLNEVAMYYDELCDIVDLKG